VSIPAAVSFNCGVGEQNIDPLVAIAHRPYDLL
jgi:hypothetical protein